MSKLDQEFEMVDVLRAEHMQLKGHLSDKGKQQVKDLMLELIGPDEKAPSETYTAEKGYHYASTLNLFKAELRQRVSEL